MTAHDHIIDCQISHYHAGTGTSTLATVPPKGHVGSKVNVALRSLNILGLAKKHLSTGAMLLWNAAEQ